MNLIEPIVLLLTYSILLLAIFVSIICYKRNMEKWETIAFSFSLLFLIVAITIPTLFGQSNSEESTGFLVIVSMILLGVTTPLSILSERQHNVSRFWKKLLYFVAVILFLMSCLAAYMDKLHVLENYIIAFLGLSVSASMILMWSTKPLKRFAHQEKANRYFAIAFLIVVPLSLWASFLAENDGTPLKIGLLLPVIFILLGANKLYDDLQRLSLIKNGIEPIEQHFRNYSLSEREKEITTLLVNGKTYNQIAETLFVSVSTVKSHASNIYKKCNVNSRHELTLLMTS